MTRLTDHQHALEYLDRITRELETLAYDTDQHVDDRDGNGRVILRNSTAVSKTLSDLRRDVFLHTPNTL